MEDYPVQREKSISKQDVLINYNIKKRDIEIEHCPTERMWSDILNKPNQGEAFHILRCVLMNIP